VGAELPRAHFHLRSLALKPWRRHTARSGAATGQARRRYQTLHPRPVYPPHLMKFTTNVLFEKNPTRTPPVVEDPAGRSERMPIDLPVLYWMIVEDGQWRGLHPPFTVRRSYHRGPGGLVGNSGAAAARPGHLAPRSVLPDQGGGARRAPDPARERRAMSAILAIGRRRVSKRGTIEGRWAPGRAGRRMARGAAMATRPDHRAVNDSRHQASEDRAQSARVAGVPGRCIAVTLARASVTGKAGDLGGIRGQGS
jgi:hypothetical protein